MKRPTFTEALQAASKRSGKTKAAIARDSGVNYDALVKLLSGENKSTSPENVAKLAKVLGNEIMDSATGFAEPVAQPRLDTSGIPDRDSEPSVANTSSDVLNQIKLALNNGLIQVAGTYDRTGVEALIEALENMKRFLPDNEK